MIPFAVVGSNRSIVIDGRPVRVRRNKWGVINVENEQHCEFNYLRNFLTRYVMLLCHSMTVTDDFVFAPYRTHLQDLIEVRLANTHTRS